MVREDDPRFHGRVGSDWVFSARFD
ncbi:hypothetical protein KIPB_007435, partial [Kipferlia bialata]|eukprot:g7435.t1